MIRTVVCGLAILSTMLALAPQRIGADAPVFFAELPTANANGGPDSWPGDLQSQENVRRHLAEFQHVAEVQWAFRRSMLAALTPEHCQLLARIAGALTIAPDPDLESAVRRLNAALTPQEARNVLDVERAKENETRRQFRQTRIEAGAPTTQYGIIAMRTSGAAPFGRDAGSILLRTAATALMMPKIDMLAP